MGYEIVSKEEIIKLRKEASENLDDFDRRFFDNLDLLVDRMNKLQTLEPGTLDYYTYYDMVLIQMRAMLIETVNRKERKHNQTFQNYLNKIGQADLAKEIDNYLDIKLFEEVTLREGIKLSVDKFIAHYDNVNNEEIRIEREFRKILTENNDDKNIKNIIKNLVITLLKATTRAWANYYLHCCPERNESIQNNK